MKFSFTPVLENVSPVIVINLSPSPEILICRVNIWSIPPAAIFRVLSGVPFAAKIQTSAGPEVGLAALAKMRPSAAISALFGCSPVGAGLAPAPT